MTTHTGLGWGNTSPFQVTLYRKIVGDTNAVASGTKRKGSGTYTLISNAITTRPTISLISPCQALLTYDQKLTKKLIGSPIPTGNNQKPITTGQLWPRY